jgi:predicted GH43/DUF377 family glycosyl hydrolase
MPSTGDFVIFFTVVIIAFGITGFFFYVLWKAIRTILTPERIAAIVEALHLTRSEGNPLLRQGPYQWEQQSVLNPAVVEAGGRTHMFYRAVGSDGVSRLGYASSADGVDFDERLPYPVYTVHDPRGEGRHYRYDPVLYPSGGSWGGAEDPRAVVIDDKLYLSFNMFDGWDYIRVAMVTLGIDDLIHKRWNWSKPTFLSPKGQIHKDQVRVEFVDDPMRVGVDLPNIISPDPKSIPNRPAAWHLRTRSAGPPPLKTALGWLFFYHAHDHEGDRYKMGAALLDLLDPTKIIARSPLPVLVPDASYENEGKPGIVYGCGATIKDDTLRVYYGGGDSVVCAASAHLPTFLDTLMAHGTPQLARI